MHIVVGVADLEQTKIVASQLQVLGLPRASIELAHVVERFGESGMPPFPGTRAELLAQYLKAQADAADQLLVAARAEMQQRALTCSTKLLNGFAANELMEHARAVHADLLAVGSSGKGALKGAIIGSVSRKAVIGAPCSVLVGKKAAETTAPKTAVFATDHSTYANLCLELFLKWQPRGIEKAVVTSVFPQRLIESMRTAMPHMKVEVASEVLDELERGNAQLIEKLAPLGATFTSRVESGVVGETLQRVMHEEKADLLVLGAKGHGLVKRMTIGSVSLDQAIRGSYSVLILRV